MLRDWVSGLVKVFFLFVAKIVILGIIRKNKNALACYREHDQCGQRAAQGGLLLLLLFPTSNGWFGFADEAECNPFGEASIHPLDKASEK